MTKNDRKWRRKNDEAWELFHRNPYAFIEPPHRIGQYIDAEADVIGDAILDALNEEVRTARYLLFESSDVPFESRKQAQKWIDQYVVPVEELPSFGSEEGLYDRGVGPLEVYFPNDDGQRAEGQFVRPGDWSPLAGLVLFVRRVCAWCGLTELEVTDLVLTGQEYILRAWEIVKDNERREAEDQDRPSVYPLTKRNGELLRAMETCGPLPAAARGKAGAGRKAYWSDVARELGWPGDSARRMFGRIRASRPHLTRRYEAAT
jgi:hypothetical protein